MVGPVRAVEADVAGVVEGADSDAHTDKAVPEESAGGAPQVVAETETGPQRVAEGKAQEDDKTGQQAA